LMVCVLISYGFYNFRVDQKQLLLTFGSFISLFYTLIFAIAVSHDISRTKINIRTLSFIFFPITLISNLIFFFVDFSSPIYTIFNGIILLIFTLFVYSIKNAKQ